MGYALVDNSTICVPCPDGCASCSDTTTCTSCIAGYYYDGVSICPKCDDKCSVCHGASEKNCTVCAPKHFLHRYTCYTKSKCPGARFGDASDPLNPICNNCHSSCTQCFSNLSTTCSNCATGFYISTTSCLRCDKRCLACFGGSNLQCTYCAENYYL